MSCFFRRLKSLFLVTEVPELLPEINLLELFFRGLNCCSDTNFCMLHETFYMFEANFYMLHGSFYLWQSFLFLIVHVSSWFFETYLCKGFEYTMLFNYSILLAFMQYTECSSEIDKVRRELPWIFCSATFWNFKLFVQTLNLFWFIIRYLYWSKFCIFELLVLFYWFMLI